MDVVSFVELCAALATIGTPILSMLYADLQKHVTLDAKVESIAADVIAHKATLAQIQTDVETLLTAVKVSTVPK